MRQVATGDSSRLTPWGAKGHDTVMKLIWKLMFPMISWWSSSDATEEVVAVNDEYEEIIKSTLIYWWLLRDVVCYPQQVHYEIVSDLDVLATGTVQTTLSIFCSLHGWHARLGADWNMEYCTDYTTILGDNMISIISRYHVIIDE